MSSNSMSTPVSNIADATRRDESAPATDGSTDVEPILEVDDETPALELDEQSDELVTESVASDADPVSETAKETTEETPKPSESRRGASFLVLVLGALLLISVAINLKQSRDVGQLEQRSTEYQQALAAAVERIDSEAARADGAEAALDRVDSAVDVVNERVLGLQEALEGLREATVR